MARQSELDPRIAPESDASTYERCPDCQGRHGNESCSHCQGLGYIRPSDDPTRGKDLATLPPDERPAWVERVGRFLEARALVERHGLWDALRVLCPDYGPESSWHPVFLSSLSWFDAELARLKHESDVERARRDREAAANRGR